MTVANPLHVSLSDGVLQIIEHKIASGEFESVDAVLEESVRHMDAVDARIEDWANTEGLRRLGEYDADPSKGLSWQQLRSRIVNKSGLRKAG